MHTEVCLLLPGWPRVMLKVVFADISGGNVAFTTRALDGLSLEDMFKVIGAPKTQKLARLDGEALAPSMPSQLVEKVRWAHWIDEDDEDIRVIDFGEAFARGAEPDQLAEPPGLQVPEKILTGKFDYRVDLWRAGCMVRHPDSYPSMRCKKKMSDAAGQIYTLLSVPGLSRLSGVIWMFWWRR